MKFFHVTSLSDCQDSVEKNLPRSVYEAQSLATVDAVSHILAADVLSCDLFPPYDRSTMDGYAVIAEDVYCASASLPAFLKVKGKVIMGERSDISVERGEAVAIPTGGILPVGANAVVMIENTEVLNDGEIAIYAPVKRGENVVNAGEEVRSGDVLARRGERVSPLLAGIFSSVGIEKVKVFDRIKVGIISTGDELVSVSGKAADGKIRDVNTSYLSALCLCAGYDVTYAIRIPDSEDLLTKSLADALTADIVLVSGGSSIGAKDLTEKVLSSGKILLHGVALKPGKPTVIAKFNDKLVFGLPGNPFAAACVFQLLCDDVIKRTRGEKPTYLYAYAKTNFPSSPGRTTIMPVCVAFDGEKYLAEPVFLKSAHLYSAVRADGFAILKETAEGIYAGEKLKIYPFIGKGVL